MHYQKQSKNSRDIAADRFRRLFKLIPRRADSALSRGRIPSDVKMPKHGALVADNGFIMLVAFFATVLILAIVEFRL